MIDLLPDTDQQALIDSAADFLKRRLSEAGPDSNEGPLASLNKGLWAECGSLGWFSIGLEGSGDGGMSLVEETLLCRELGRRLMPIPFVATMVAVRMAALCGASELSHELASGEVVVGLAERYDESKAVSWESFPADMTLFVDHREGSVKLVNWLEPAGSGSQRSIDPEVSIQYVESPRGPEVVLDGGHHAPLSMLSGAILTAGMLSGIAEQTRDDSVSYAKSRTQYGKPIGSFQAVQHRCADMALRAERAWAQSAVASLRVRSHGWGAQFEGHAAKVVSADAATKNGRDNIQNHGGIGFTSEHSAHRYLKRAEVLEYVFGGTGLHLHALMDLDVAW